MKKCEEQQSKLGAWGRCLPLQQLLLALPLGSQLAVFLGVLGLQAPEPHALPSVARALRIEGVKLARLLGSEPTPGAELLGVVA
jgi:hypothetical protein